MKRRKRKYGFWLVVLLTVLGCAWFFQRVRAAKAYIEPGECGASYDVPWGVCISDYYNRRGISMVVDGKKINTINKGLYMNEDRVIMVSERVVRDIFDCAVIVFGDGSVNLLKGDTKVTLSLASKEGYRNELLLSLRAEPVRIGTEVYVPLDSLEKGLAYDVMWEQSSETAIITSKGAVSLSLPYFYDYRQEGRATSVKNQGEYGTCWAFAALTALETTLAPLGQNDFSEDHMGLSEAFGRDDLGGGDYTMAAAYLTSWDGPVREEDDPYGDGVREEAKTQYHVQEVQFPAAKDYNMIKKMVYQYGGVQSSIYLAIGRDSMTSYYYNPETYAYCYAGTKKVNHDIVIIGWDDNYPAENFSIDVDQNGAFICQNSWGSDFGDNGIFYVSYYDTHIGMYNCVYTGVEHSDNYDTIYQSDLTGWSGNIGYGNGEAYFENVYTAESDCTLEAVGFYATGAYTSYSVYTTFQTGQTGFISRQENGNGSFTNAGYYTVPLERPVALKKGEQFIVMVYINTPNVETPVAVEYSSEERADIVDLEDGEGYVSQDGIHWEHLEEQQKANLCLKAYTKNIR